MRKIIIIILLFISIQATAQYKYVTPKINKTIATIGVTMITLPVIGIIPDNSKFSQPMVYSGFAISILIGMVNIHQENKHKLEYDIYSDINSTGIKITFKI